MTSSITCPQCGLAQEKPSDGVCQGCANPLAPVVAPAKSVLGLTSAGAVAKATLGARIAGVVLLLNAVANGISMIKEGPGSGPLANQELKAMIVDLVFGGGLLVAGNARLQKWALIRVVLGLLFFGAMFGAQHDTMSLALQAGFSAALLLLLVGDAGKARIGAGATLSAAYLLLATAGVVQTWTGSNPAAAALLTSRGEISPAAGRLKGDKFDYCLSVPEERWYLRAAQLAARDNPSSDRWLTRPDLDAHVMIMAESVEPSLRINQDKFEQAVIEEMKGRLTSFENLGREPLPGGAMLHLRGHAKTLDLEYYRGLFAYRNRGYQVVAFATPKSFARAEPELASMVRSFHPTCGGGPTSAR
jgi:hypothetical protein